MSGSSNKDLHNDEGINSVGQFVNQTSKLKSERPLYRGLANFDWQVEASAYRRIKHKEDDIRGDNKESTQETPPPKVVFQNYIETLLDKASLQGFHERSGRSLSDLELLAELQHNGAATCLIDFTSDPLIALWFACNDQFDMDGKVVVMETEGVGNFSTITHDDLKKEIKEFFGQDEQGRDKQWTWTPSHLSSRIVAQHSVFVFGKGEIEKRHYKPIKINKESKQDIVKELQHIFGITEEHLFGDFTGFALSNAHDKTFRIQRAEDFFSWGNAYNRQRKRKKAIEYYSRAIEIDPTNPATYINRGNVKGSLGDHQGAIKDHSKAIELDPKLAEAHNNRGTERSALEDKHGAIADYNKAIELNPQLFVAYNNRGNVKHQLEHHKEALKDYDEAIRINPQYAEAYCNRGVAKKALGDYQGSMGDFNEAVRIDPQHVMAYYNRGILKSDLENHQGALEDHNKAIDLNPQFAEAYQNRGASKYELGDTQGAIKDFDEAIRLNPQYAGAYYNRGIAKSDLENYQDAIKDYSKAIELDPQYAKAYHNRALAKKTLGDKKGAEEDLRKAKELEEKNR